MFCSCAPRCASSHPPTRPQQAAAQGNIKRHLQETRLQRAGRVARRRAAVRHFVGLLASMSMAQERQARPLPRIITERQLRASGPWARSVEGRQRDRRKLPAGQWPEEARGRRTRVLDGREPLMEGASNLQAEAVAVGARIRRLSSW
jgi:hypothetical protein